VGRRDEAVEWLRWGLSPDRIADEMGISLSTVLGYLDQMVGEGVIRRSDIYFSLSEEERKNPAAWEHAEIVERYGNARDALGDMYEELRDIETSLHGRIRDVLVERHGPEESGWWRRGVPINVRKKCVERREEDLQPISDPYCYTDLLDLRAILDSNWTELNSVVGTYGSDKPKLLRDLVRLNEIRRTVMHPIRGGVPVEDDFSFLRSMREALST
jgi:hypothetical protein